MNGFTPSIDVAAQIKNLAEQIPERWRAVELACCIMNSGNPYDTMRLLNGRVITKAWQAREEAEELEWYNNWLDDQRTIASHRADMRQF